MQEYGHYKLCSMWYSERDIFAERNLNVIWLLFWQMRQVEASSEK
jgi:hypothetical protein